MNVRACLVGLSAVALLSVASCAAQHAPGAPPRQAPVGPEPRTVDEAQADIDQWSAQLGMAKAPATEPGVTPPGTGPVTPAPSPPPDRPSAPPATQSSPTSAGAAADSSSGGDARVSECVMPCRAIASMRRSVSALCRIAGEDDPRCVAAKKTLEEGERRVARCGC